MESKNLFLVDFEPATCNLDPSNIEAAITPRTSDTYACSRLREAL